MNIANIFGLHLNCRVKVYNAIADLLAVNKQGVVEIFTNGDDSSSLARVENCKLILKPLSKITDEDKAEFQTTFKIKEKILGFDISSSGAVLVCTEFGDFDGDPIDKYDDINYSQLLWLASKGYDIGLVPDEYCEVAE